MRVIDKTMAQQTITRQVTQVPPTSSNHSRFTPARLSLSGQRISMQSWGTARQQRRSSSASNPIFATRPWQKKSPWICSGSKESTSTLQEPPQRSPGNTGFSRPTQSYSSKGLSFVVVVVFCGCSCCSCHLRRCCGCYYACCCCLRPRRKTSTLIPPGN